MRRKTTVLTTLLILMNLSRRIVLWGLILCCVTGVRAQRTYIASSVLATGNWYQLSIKEPGIYKIDIPFLNSLGVSTSGLSSASVRLFGNGGAMLAEANADFYQDDLQENAIMVVDGGDGVINGSDYILFYANGPEQWMKDSANLRFSHKKNIYSDRSYYFLTIGGNGKRIALSPPVFPPNLTITSFSERSFHELDTVNFLASGKEWYGEEFSNTPGKSTTRDFSITIPNIQTSSSLFVKTNFVARSVGVSSRPAR